MNQIINMILRLFAGPALRSGAAYFASRGKKPAEMTPEARKQAVAAKATAKRARQAMRLMRRMGR